MRTITRSLADVNPDLASQAYGWDPTTVTEFSNRKVDWSCAKDHVWKAKINNRSNGADCPYCANQKILAGFNDLATLNPDLADQAYGWDPATVSIGSNRKVSWKCEKEHVWDTTVAHRVSGTRCPYCSNNRVLAGFNDLATTRPDLAEQAHDFDPRTVMQSSRATVAWMCDEGHTYRAAIYNRSNGKGCPYRAGKKVLAGFNDLATTMPLLALEAHGFDTTTVTRYSHKKVGWKCEEGHIWKSAVNNRTKGQGCPTCNPGGFDPSKPGWLYFLEHPEFNLFQIGISNGFKRRLRDHARDGWVPIDVSEAMLGKQAYEYEQGARKSIKSRGGVFTDHFGNVKSGGYSEVWTRDSFNLASISELIGMVDAEAEKVGVS